MRLNFPVINQRITTLQDGTRDSNSDWDCVPECLAGILEFYTGKHFEGGVLKELVYGRNYRGGTDAHAYVPLLAHYGCKLYPIDGDPQALVVLAHQHIKAGHPVVITEPDPYMPAGSGDTHVIVLDEEHSGGVFAMDPFIAREVEFTDAQLAAHMAVREVWIAEKIGANEIVSISLSTPGISEFFKAGVGNSWVCLKNGFVVHDGMLNFYRTMGGSLGGLTQAGLPLSNEINLGHAGHPEIVEQEFERLTLRYDPNHVMDNPPGASSVYVVHRPDVPAIQVQLQAQLAASDAKVIAMSAKLQNIEELAKV
jgi:hypothetical protein